MRIGLISCIHANLAAMEAVLRDAQQMHCNMMLCLGDIVGYFDHPRECVDLVRTHCQISVKGNHDEICSASDSLRDYGPRAAEDIEWTRGELSPSERRWLADLPYFVDVGDFTIVHASLAAPWRWEYIFDPLAAATHFAKQTKALCFNGHTHMPFAFQSKDGDVSGGRFTRFTIEPGIKYLVNVGSVGQPRDGTTDATYVVYDETDEVVELRRVDYPRPPSGGHGVSKPGRGGSGPRGVLKARSDYPKDEREGAS